MQEQKAKTLTTWNLVMLALGSTVGGSFFLSTAVPLRNAGPGTLIAFAVGGLLIYIILMALSELTVSRPTHGSFREYAEVAFGPMASFVVGWVYWAGLMLAMSSEAVAAALFARLWLPGVPLWLISLVIVVGVMLLNLMDPKVFGAVEGVMSAGKLLTIAAFIALMLVLLGGLIPRAASPGLSTIRAEPFLPRGLGGLGGSMLIVLFAYAGFEVLGLAAPEAQNPVRTVPRAVVLTVISLLVLYIGAMAMVLFVVPVGTVREDVSPLVTALQRTGLPAVAPVLNFIVMTASLSTMLAATYGLGRMLQSLAEEGQAPRLFARLTPAGVPRNAVLTSAAGMLIGVALSYLLPKRVYLFLVSSGGFSLLFAYLVILASQLVIRRKEGCPASGCQLPYYPYSTWLGIVLLVAAMAAMPLVPGQGAGLVVGLALVAASALAYGLVRRPAPEPEAAADRPDDRVPLG